MMLNPIKIIKNIFLYIKYLNIIKKSIEEENFINKLSRLLKVNIKRDWWGRLYFVVCPNLQHTNEQIYELTELGYNNETYIAKWLLTNFNIIEKYVTTSNMLDVLIYDINVIDSYNYLILLYPPNFFEFKKAIKGVFVWILLIIILMIILLLIFF